jgi:hypothetical protein
MTEITFCGFLFFGDKGDGVKRAGLFALPAADTFFTV